MGRCENIFVKLTIRLRMKRGSYICMNVNNFEK